ncbi:hypothetical protein EV127DRAFT_440930 [Xylaria flabelliformis]|nr:hypothetical protein EV127DRAFT_440930 [Xylaria flabelliformis]
MEVETDRDYTLHVNSSRRPRNVGRSQIPNEKKWLEVLRWSKHIVNDITPTKDPLARRSPGVRSHRMGTDNWLYLEWLENGTVKNLVGRAIQLGITLPNRLLWRFFLCLIRMCIAMDWPAKKPEDEDPQPVREVPDDRARGGLIHGDMHDENIMFGDFIPDDPDTEHRITPILKLIDLGSMQMVEGDGDAMGEAVRDNLFDIGIMMVELVTLNSNTKRNIRPSESLATKFRMQSDSQEIMTNGGVILPNGNVNPYPKLDTALRGLICSCLAAKSRDRPSASALANVVTTFIENRDKQFYASRGYEGESDDDIKSILDQLIFNAA